MRYDTHTSISSNSSRLRWRERKAAALFLTRRASRLLSPVTSGGTQSLVLIGPDGAARCRLGGGADPDADDDSENADAELFWFRCADDEEEEELSASPRVEERFRDEEANDELGV